MPYLLVASILAAAPVAGAGTTSELPLLSERPESSLSFLTALPQGGKTQQRVANLNLLIGQRTLEDDFWDPNEDQFTVGVEFDTYRHDEWVGLDAGFHYADDDTGDGFGQTTEMFLGARKTFTLGATNLHPYLAVGASYIWATNGVSQPPVIVAERDSSLGFYGRGGIYWTFSNVVNFGVDVRALFGTDIDAFGAETADYVQVAGFVGWSM